MGTKRKQGRVPARRLECAAGKQQTPLMAACAAGRLPLVKQLVANGVNVNDVNREGESALTYAVVWNQEAVVDYLLAVGARPELPPAPAWSPLMYAAFEGNRHIGAALIAKGADVSRKDGHNRTAADIAGMAGHQGWAAMAGPAPARRRR
jgi:ankyrin repeat protein